MSLLLGVKRRRPDGSVTPSPGINEVVMKFVQCRGSNEKGQRVEEEPVDQSERSASPDRQRYTLTAAGLVHTPLTALPATRHVLLLHLSAWRDAQRRARNGSCRRVDNRDRVASALRHRLVQLHVVRLLVGRWRGVERIRRRGELERRRGLYLLLKWRALWRARRQRASVGARR